MKIALQPAFSNIEKPMKDYLHICCFGLSLLVGCAEQVDENVLDQSQFTRIYREILRENSQRNPAIADSSAADSLARAIAESKGTNLARFKATIAFHMEDSGYWKEFYYQVVREIEAEERDKSSRPGLQ